MSNPVTKSPLGTWTNDQHRDIPKILAHHYYGVPAILAHCVAENTKGKAKDFITGYLKDFPEHYSQGRGAFIFSHEYGSGKSGLAAVILRECLFYDVRGYFADCSQMIKSYMTRTIIDEMEYADHVKNRADVLVIDDLKVSTGRYGSMSVDIIEDILKTRANRQAVTIVTSNLNLEDVETKLTRAIRELITASCLPIKLGDYNWRQAKKDENESFVRKYLSDNGS